MVLLYRVENTDPPKRNIRNARQILPQASRTTDSLGVTTDAAAAGELGLTAQKTLIADRENPETPQVQIEAEIVTKDGPGGQNDGIPNKPQ